MSITVYILIVYAAMYLSIQVLQALTYLRPQRLPAPKLHPRVCVLLAARNEEDNIADTLDSLLAQNYPTDRLTILIGDDASEDRTAEIIRGYTDAHPHLAYHHIDRQINGLYGKQNVLAVLSEEIPEDTEVLLFTDADISHPTGWIAQMAAVLNSGHTEMCSGTTLVEGPALFHKLQTLDWLIGIATIVAFTRIGLPITAVGNNMGIRKDWYDRIGGYAGIPFSITEDYILFERLRRAGGRFRWLHVPVLTLRSKPLHDLRTFFHQRKRWFKGGSKGPWYAVTLFAFQGAILPIVAWGLFFAPMWIWLMTLGAKVLGDALLLLAAAGRLRRWDLLRWYPIYAIYYPLEILVLGIYFILPTKLTWKGRRF